MMAMLKLWRSQVLRDLGWKLLLQIHDEVILEGPKETVNEVRLPLSQSCANMSIRLIVPLHTHRP